MNLLPARKFLSTLRSKQKGFSILKKGQTGFTLIELLVVIGILGILAAALVATIDPFEQLKKADDANIKNMAVEFQTANVRYYTTHGSFPWDDAASTNNACLAIAGVSGGQPTGTIDGMALGVAGMVDCLGSASTTNSLIGEGELKAGFTSSLNNLNRIFVQWDSASASDMKVCFSPRSKSQKAAPDTKYTNVGAPNASCPDSTAADDVCYWCTQ